MTDKKARVAKVLFADAVIETLDGDKALPAKFRRMLKKLSLEKRLKDKSVAIKMHLGGGTSFTTIHPVFVRTLVEEVKAAGAKSVKAMDGYAGDALPRGYTREVLGCPVVSCFGETGKYLYREEIKYKSLDEVLYGGEAVDTDVFIDFSHVKAHGNCGFGGALKNIAMGVVPNESRGKLHGTEGGITYHKDKCKFCLKCKKACAHEVISYDKAGKTLNFFLHHCTGCRHCVLACPEKAIEIDKKKFGDFSHAMALCTAHFLKKFKPENLLFINMLTNITILCDCWGFSTPSLVPDIGILASDDIAAIDTASLDMIKEENLLSSGLPKGRKLLKEGRHLFEKIHGKDPYLMIKHLQEYYPCTTKYEIEEIR